MKILAIDTSSNFFQIAFNINNHTYQYISKTKADHSQNLVQATSNLAAKHQITLQDLHEIRIVVGPGSYTGLRIGLAYAKTLKFLYPHITITSVSKFEFLATSLKSDLIKSSNIAAILSCGKNKDEYFLQIIMQNSTHQEKMHLISKEKLLSFNFPENTTLVSDCDKLDSLKYYHFENGSISSLAKSSCIFFKRNVEIIYLREIYAKKVF